MVLNHTPFIYNCTKTCVKSYSMGVSFLTEKNHTIENGGEFHPNMCNMTQKKIESISLTKV